MKIKKTSIFSKASLAAAWLEKGWEKSREKISAPWRPRMRPAQSSSPYQVTQDAQAVEQVFERLQHYFYQRFIEQRQPDRHGDFPAPVELFWESGQLEPGRAYFYLKKPNEIGWLFERSGHGWVISRCEKIIQQDLFLRRDEPWDVATLYSHQGHYRVASLQTGQQLLSFLLYRKIAFKEVVSVELQDWLTS